MEMKELIEKIADLQFKLGIADNKARESERVKNVLLNNLDAIVDALRKYEKCYENIVVAETELDDAERELKEQDDLIADLAAELERLEPTNALLSIVDKMIRRRKGEAVDEEEEAAPTEEAAPQAPAKKKGKK